jgi:hypothetical protein
MTERWWVTKLSAFALRRRQDAIPSNPVSLVEFGEHSRHNRF